MQHNLVLDSIKLTHIIAFFSFFTPQTDKFKIMFITVFQEIKKIIRTVRYERIKKH
jgi:hypothetical protein